MGAWHFLAGLALAGESNTASTESLTSVPHLTPSLAACCVTVCYFPYVSLIFLPSNSELPPSSKSFLPSELLLYLDNCTVYLSCTSIFLPPLLPFSFTVSFEDSSLFQTPAGVSGVW